MGPVHGQYGTSVVLELLDSWLLLVEGGEISALFRDPDGHLFEISELT